jgi:hypothetical protein
MARHLLASNNRISTFVDKDLVKRVLAIKRQRRESGVDDIIIPLTVTPPKGSLTDPSIEA